MRCNSLMRAGVVGAIGMGLCVCLSAQADTSPPPAAASNQSPAPASSKTATTDDAQAASSSPAAITEALFSPQSTPWQKVTVKPGDSLSRVFARVGLKAKAWVALLKIGDQVEPLKTLKVGDTLELRKTPDGRLAGLRYPLDAVDTLWVTRQSEPESTAGALRADIRRADTRTRRITATGAVAGSLPQSLAAAGIPAGVATELAHIYRYRANLSRNMHPGDRFSVIYEAEFDHEVRISAGPIIAASISTDGRTLQAFRARDAQGKQGYYDPNGRPYQPAFSRHPVDYTRISSRFSPDRMHPILHVRRAHWGVDMAAPQGTAIRAAANGTVEFVGRKHGYGKLVELDNFDGYSTRYAHMSSFVKGLHDGDNVRKGQTIGYVGATGEATGPHVHFEIRIDGVAHNPLTMSLPDGHPLTARRLALFANRIQPLEAKLDTGAGIQGTLIAATAGSIRYNNCSGAGAINAVMALAPSSAPSHHSLTEMFCVIATGANVWALQAEFSDRGVAL